MLLPHPLGPDDGDRLALRDLERHAAQRMNVAVGIDLAQPFRAEDRPRRGREFSHGASASLGSRAEARAAG